MFNRLFHPDTTHSTRVQRLEAGALFVAITITYFYSGGNGWLYVLLILAPDISMVGYLSGPRIGAYVYNFGHSLAAPLVLITAGVLTGNVLAQQLAQIWLAHIGFDRLMGYGLKETTHFQDTHLGRIGH